MPYSVFRNEFKDLKSCFQLKNIDFRGEYEGALVSFSTRCTRSYMLITSPMYRHMPGCSASRFRFPDPRIRCSIARDAQFSSVSRPRLDGITYVIQFMTCVCEETHMARMLNPCIHQSVQHSFQYIIVPQGTQFLA